MTQEAKHELFTIIDRVAGQLDITKTQYEIAEKRYNAVGKWLAEGIYCNGNVCLRDGEIYPQGSMRLATAVKPIGQNEFDVDLVFFSPNVSRYNMEPSELNRLIGDRLREHSEYKRMMEKSPNQGRIKRGWRITYADEFHLDITPSINNDSEGNNSEYVPDRKEQNWKPSNPKDYADWFNKCAEKTLLYKMTDRSMIIEASASHSVVDFPENDEMKPLLKRYVQILKRHRDVMFNGKDNKPISIILTTLATHAYNYCINNRVYDNELDLLCDVIKVMPKYIEGYEGNYQIMNPTTEHENFAERWNENSAKKKAFDLWHEKAVEFFDSLYSIVGQNRIFESLEKGFGKKPVSKVYEDINLQVAENRTNGLLGLALSSGTTTTPMKQNTFFGGDNE